MAGPVIAFFGGYDDATKQQAIDHVRANGWTQDDVAIKPQKPTPDDLIGAYLVIAKRRLW
jgi:hypothetical protein